MNMTSNEILYVGELSGGIGFAAGALLGLVFMNLMVGLLVFVAISVLGTLGLSNLILKYKANRPVGFLFERVHRLRQEWGLGGSELVLRSGKWGRGRRL